MKVKIELDKHQTPEDAEEQLFKALNASRIGESHDDDERFLDPAAEHVASIIKEKYKRMYEAMQTEIFEELDKEYD